MLAHRYQDGKQRIPQALRPSIIPQRLWSAVANRDPPIRDYFQKAESDLTGSSSQRPFLGRTGQAGMAGMTRQKCCNAGDAASCGGNFLWNCFVLFPPVYGTKCILLVCCLNCGRAASWETKSCRANFSISGSGNVSFRMRKAWSCRIGRSHATRRWQPCAN